MGNQLRLMDQACNELAIAEGAMDAHEADGHISPEERRVERQMVRLALVILSAACYRRQAAEWESKHLPGTPRPHYLLTNRRDIMELLRGGKVDEPTSLAEYRRTRGGPRNGGEAA